MWVWIPKFPFLTRSHTSAASEAFSPELLDGPCGVPICGLPGALWGMISSLFGLPKLAHRKLEADLCCALPALQLQCYVKI